MTARALDRRGVDLLAVADVAACLERLRFSAWHLCLVCTSRADAAAVRRRVREERIAVPVLPPRPGEEGRPPRDLEALVARRLARGAARPLRGVPLELAGLEVDPASHGVRVGGLPLELNRQQFRLLYLLALRSPEPLRRGELAAQLRRSDAAASVRAVDSLVCRLRRTLSAADGAPAVVTVPGVGYRLSCGATAPPDATRPRTPGTAP